MKKIHFKISLEENYVYIYKYKDLKYFGKITIKKQKVLLIWMLNKFLDEKYRIHLTNISLGITKKVYNWRDFFFIVKITTTMLSSDERI